jgi:hypothetical protein
MAVRAFFGRRAYILICIQYIYRYILALLHHVWYSTMHIELHACARYICIDQFNYCMHIRSICMHAWCFREASHQHPSRTCRNLPPETTYALSYTSIYIYSIYVFKYIRQKKKLRDSMRYRAHGNVASNRHISAHNEQPPQTHVSRCYSQSRK